ncbi:MAG: CBS domain-containing protein, partial [Proteobacteria bacterium]|nr:CBS domain-containing protein [Pseudomonadota bacterium]
MTREVETVAPDASLQAAAAAMEAEGVGSLPVCQGRRLLGAITDRDIVIRGVATGASPVDMTVRECMSEEISYAFEDEDAEAALKRMEALQVRRLAVL